MTETRLAFSDALGRRVRMGSWEDQKISTYRKIHEAIDAGDWSFAAQLANYFVEEASVCYGIYRQWIPDLNAFLAENGVSKADIAEANERIVATLAFPDGAPWNLRTQSTSSARRSSATSSARRAPRPMRSSTSSRRRGAGATTATSTTPTG
jgi:hypothetical protein